MAISCEFMHWKAANLHKFVLISVISGNVERLLKESYLHVHNLDIIHKQDKKM